MRALTTPGIMPAIRRRARRKGISVQQALTEREQASLRLFLTAAERMATNQERVDVINAALDEGLLSPETGDAA